MAKCKFCSKEHAGSGCPDCGASLYDIGATIVYGPTVEDACDCEIEITAKYLFIRRMSKKEKRTAIAGRALGGLVGMIAAEGITNKSNEYGWYPLSDFSRIIYPYITKKSKLAPGIKLITKDGRDMLLIFDKPGVFDSSRKAAKVVAGKLGEVIPVTEDSSKQNFGSIGCQNPYVTEENFDKFRPSSISGCRTAFQPAPRTAPEKSRSVPVADMNRMATKTSVIRRPCPRCGFFVLETNKFCNECGEKMYKEKKCIRCGKILLENEKFCGECGYQVK